MVNDYDKKKDKDSKYEYKSIYTFVSSNFETLTTFIFFCLCLSNGLFYSFSKKVIEDR